MNFELLNLDAAQAGHEKCDVLVMLLASTFKAGRNPLSTVIGKALKAGDLADKPGSLLDIYRPAGLACARLVLVRSRTRYLPQVSCRWRLVRIGCWVIRRLAGSHRSLETPWLCLLPLIERLP